MYTRLFVILIILVTSLAASRIVLSDDDKEKRGFLAEVFTRSSAITPVANQLYTEECGGCHYAYPPGLLPAASWKKLLNQLENHFGDNAELAKRDRAAILDYLQTNSADKSSNRLSNKIMKSLSDEQTPMRITEVPYIKHEHHELPRRIFKTNDKVGSLSNCSACHTDAASGSFSEREINIPGVGRWDD
jgi:cytochrome c553